MVPRENLSFRYPTIDTSIINSLVAAVAAITLTIIFLPKNEEGPNKVNNVTKKEFDIESESLESFKFMKRMDESNLFYLGLDAVSIDGTDMAFKSISL